MLLDQSGAAVREPFFMLVKFMNVDTHLDIKVAGLAVLLKSYFKNNIPPIYHFDRTHTIMFSDSWQTV